MKIIWIILGFAIYAFSCNGTYQCYTFTKESTWNDPYYTFYDDALWIDGLMNYPCGSYASIRYVDGLSDENKEYYGTTIPIAILEFHIHCTDNTVIKVSPYDITIGYIDITKFVKTSYRKTTKPFKTCRKAIKTFMKRIVSDSQWNG